MLTIYNNIKRILKNRLLKSFAIVTKDNITNQNFVTIGSRTASTRYKSLYLGKESYVINSFKFSFNIVKYFLKFKNEYGIVIVKKENLIKPHRNLFVMQPDFIVFEIPLPENIDDYLNSITTGARNNLKRVKKMGFTSTITSDKEWVETFYDNYYVPTMVHRHADDAAVIERQDMISIINDSGAEFVKLFLDGVCVAAALTRFNNERYYYEKIGYLNGDVSLLDKGIVAGLYQFRIQRAFELGCRTIELGGAPPLLENGVLKFKSNWQARFCPNIYFNENYLFLNPSNKNCYAFLQTNSLVVYGLKNNLIVLSSKNPKETNISEKILSDITSWYILRKTRIDNYTTEMEDLPEHLRYWYEKYYDIN